MIKPIKIYNDTNRFTIDWTLNTLCTYHCSYCHPSLHMGKNIFKDKVADNQLISNFLQRLYNALKGRPVHMWLNGGEPTISPVFETIIDFVDQVGWHAHVNTNGSRSLAWWQEYAKKIYKVTISYHPESVIDEEIFEKVEYIGSQTNVGVFTLMYPPLWNKAVSAYERFKSMERVTIAPSRVFKRQELQVANSYEYSQDQLDWLEKNSNVIFRPGVRPESPKNSYGRTYVEYDDGTVELLDEIEFTNNRKNKFISWKCSMGRNHIFIDGNWEIYHATCGTAKRFTTVDKFVTLPDHDIVCKSEYCMCTADVLIPKYK